MKKNIIVVLSMLFALLGTMQAQNPVIINFSDASPTGVSVTVDVTTDNFVNISGMQLFIGWDETVLTFDEIININSDLDGFNLSSFATPPQIPEGHVNVSWFSTNSSGASETLADGTILFSIVLNVIGAPCDETTFDLVDYNGQPNEAYDVNFDIVEVQYNPGLVNIPGTDCGTGGTQFGLGLIGEELIAEAGTNVCVAITVDSFVNVNSAQFAVQYDENILEYTGWIDGPLNDELVNPTGTNYIRFLWLVPANEAPNTLADGETLVEFCFNVIGNNGDMSPINIVSITTPPALDIEFINGDGEVIPYYVDPGKVTVGTPPDNPVTFIASDEIGDQNSNVCIDITCENFVDIGSFQWAFTWDNSVMNYTGLGSVNNINIKPTDINQVTNNKLRVSWLPTTAVTQADSTVLFQLCFDMVGNCDDTTDASFTNDGSSFQIEVGDGNGNPLNYTVFNGSAAIECACILNYTKNDVSCNGDKDGNIYVTLTGCNAQSFIWNTGQTTQNLEGIGAGIYIVTVTDDNGNQIISDQIVISEPTAIGITDSITHVSCEGKGSIQLTVSGGTAGYTYTWSPNVGNGSSVNGLGAGVYTVTVTDQNNCKESKSFNITSSLATLEISSTMKDITCRDANDGVINIVASGGCTPYQIAWSDGQAAGMFDRTNLAASIYTLTVTDNNGSAKTTSLTITNPTFAMSIEGVVTDAVVGGQGLIDISVSGGEPDYTFEWSNGETTEDISSTVGTYTVNVTDSRGCSIQAAFNIREYLDKVTLDVVAVDVNGYAISCNGECDGKVNVSVTANEPWTLFVDGVQTDINAVGQMDFCAGDHIFKVVDAIDQENEITVEITEPDLLTVALDEITCSNGDDGTISVLVTGGVEDYIFDWGVGGDGDFLIEGLDIGTYGLIVTDANKCQTLLSNIEIPRCETGDCFTGSPIITPNNDDINEYFTIACLRDYPENKLDVYDRWGRKVFSQTNYDGSWQGVGTDGALAEGSYMWVLIAFLPNGDERIYKGTMTILR